jgi:hypothetical protein
VCVLHRPFIKPQRLNTLHIRFCNMTRKGAGGSSKVSPSQVGSAREGCTLRRICTWRTLLKGGLHSGRNHADTTWGGAGAQNRTLNMCLRVAVFTRVNFCLRLGWWMQSRRVWKAGGMLIQQHTRVPGHNCSSTFTFNACNVSVIFTPLINSYWDRPTFSGLHTLKNMIKGT